MPEYITTDLPKLIHALSKFGPAQLNRLGERAGYKIGLEIEKPLKRYPGRPNYPLKWASDAQRRWYFAARREANLPIRYKRTSDPWSQKLGQSWITQRIRGGAIVGNPATYAAKVQSDEHQTEMHEDTGWTTDKQAVEQTMANGIIRAHVMAEVRHMVDEIFGGLR